MFSLLRLYLVSFLGLVILDTVRWHTGQKPQIAETVLQGQGQ